MEKTKIEWCDSTWNPVTGCYYGCPYCYGRRIAHRFSFGDETVGNNYIRKTRCLDNPIVDANGRRIAFPYGYEPVFHRYRLGEYRNKKPRTVFVCSMADLFGDWVSDSWIEEVFRACSEAPQHRYLFLTKNPQRYVELGMEGKLPQRDNMWYGTTVPTPDTEFFWADGYNTFISVEPLSEDFGEAGGHISRKCVKWVIVGAETGNRKDRTVPKKEWVDGIVGMCGKENIPLFFKNSMIKIMGDENMLREFPWQ